jgi:hypothetical protein
MSQEKLCFHCDGATVFLTKQPVGHNARKTESLLHTPRHITAHRIFLGAITSSPFILVTTFVGNFVLYAIQLEATANGSVTSSSQLI